MGMTDFYQGQTVIVLGGAGFVGRHLCRALDQRGASVVVIDNLSRQDEQTFPDDAPGKWHKLDLRRNSSRRLLTNVMSHINPFAVFNLAAYMGGVEYNQKHHNQMFLENAQLQTIPVMICERLGVPHFLQVSSACVYGTDANAPAVESNLGGEPVGANAGYSWAKRMGERAVQWSNLQHAVIVRPSNIYGPSDWYDERAHVIPKLIKGYDEGTPKIFKNSPMREFIYVQDAAKGMLHALEHGGHKEAYNLGSGGDRVAIWMIHDWICDIMGKPKQGSPDAVTPDFDPGDNSRFSDGMKLAAIGWKAKTPIADGLKRTIEAYLEG